MAQSPIPLERPLVIIGGFTDVGIVPWSLKHRFTGLTGDDQIVAVSIGDCLSFDDCKRKIIDAVNTKFHKAHRQTESQTIEVDVIGCSLGGLAARYAAMPTNNPLQGRLNIVGLFTISSPLRRIISRRPFTAAAPNSKRSSARFSVAYPNRIRTVRLPARFLRAARRQDHRPGQCCSAGPNCMVGGHAPFRRSAQRRLRRFAHSLRHRPATAREQPFTSEPPASPPER